MCYGCENLRFLITIIIVFSAHKYFIDFFLKNVACYIPE